MRQFAKRRVSQVTSVPAPVGGIDDTSPLANMDSRYAVQMKNWFPEAAALRTRFGYRQHATNLPAPGKTLMTYIPGNEANAKLFVATDSGIYDITTPTAAPVLVKALTNGSVNWTQFSNIAGNWLIVCNGVDPACLFNGTSWIDFAASGSPTNPGEISGLAPAAISNVHQHKNRLWFLAANSMTAYYWPLNAVAGAATAFPLGGIMSQGGKLSDLFSWTLDNGVSVDDVMVFQSSRGELAGYEGDDPATVGSWTLRARYFIGAPLGDRANCQVNGDVLLLTNFGVVQLSKVIGGTYMPGAAETTVSSRISKTLNGIVRARQLAVGWEIMSSPSYQYVVLSVPDASGLPTFQYVMNSLTGAWTTFDLPGKTFLEFNGYLYFAHASQGVVYKYGDVTVDNVPLDGGPGSLIDAAFQQAYDYFGDQSTSKHFKLVKPIFDATAFPSYYLKISPDFAPGGINTLNTPTVNTAGDVSAWDAGLWDQAFWSPEAATWQEWVGIEGVGYAASLLLRVACSIDTRFVSSSWVYEPGVSL